MRKVNRICLLFLAHIIAGFGATPSALAQEHAGELDLLGLLELKVETVKSEASFAESPVTLTIIDREDIRWWRYQSVAELLEHVIGFQSVKNHATPNFGVRGLAGSFFGDSSAIKVMIDGMSQAFRRVTRMKTLRPRNTSKCNSRRGWIIRGVSSMRRLNCGRALG